VDLLINVKSVTCHLIQKENLKSIINMLNIEGKVIVGNDDAKNMKRNHVIRQISCYRILVKPVC
jgi:calcineurin-like phosphoesterase family protein